jgi:hypothetical protein
VTNADLIEALRVFWPDNCQEAAAFLVALGECAEAVTFDSGMGIMPEDWSKFAAVSEALESPDLSNQSHVNSLPTPQECLLEAAGQGGVTIDSAARLLGVSRWQARQYLAELRDAGVLHLRGQGRASRWVRDTE